MENEAKTSWDDLAQQLGAEPEAGASERHQPPTTEVSPAASAASHHKPPPQAPSDWNGLANSLGVEVNTSVEPAERSSGEITKTDAEDEQQGGPDDRSAQATDPSDVGDHLPPLPSDIDQVMSDTDWSEVVAEASEESEEEQPDTEGTGISGEAARDAFDALFSAAGSAWAIPTPESKSEESPLGFSPSPEFKSLEEDQDNKFVVDDLCEDEEEADQPKRQRSRRRRRGRRGRKRSEEPVSTDESSDVDDESDVAVDSDLEELSEDDSSSDEEKPRRRRSRGRRRRSRGSSADSTAEANEDDSLEDDLELEDEQDAVASKRRSSSRSRSSHRNLPTWGEAIGVIVDANLEQRSKTPNKSGSSRGRGRGGRRRNKS